MNTKLTPEQIKTIIGKLSDFDNTAQECEICKSTEWYISHHLIEGLIYQTSDMIPFVMLYCEKCGNTKLINLNIVYPEFKL